MSLFSFRKPKFLTTLQEQGGLLAEDVRQMAGQTVSHVGSLLALLRLELAEHVVQRRRQMAFFAAAAVFVLMAYFAFCVLFGVWMFHCTGSVEVAIAIVLLFNLLAGAWAFVKACHNKPTPLAEVTREEIKNDITCLKILFSKEKQGS